ncbi:MAG: Maf family protein [Myxococcota bacterium]
MSVPRPVVLASGSPRRREILERLHIPCEVRPSRVAEVRGPGEAPADFATRAACDKATAVAEALVDRAPLPFVLGADTVVVVDDRVLGKPADDDEAADMLRLLSGRWHEVITAVALACGGEGVVEALAIPTAVRFRAASEATLARYVATGEGRDKAGAYAVQGLGAGLVRAVHGSYENVVGLPAVETLELLERHGALGDWP